MILNRLRQKDRHLAASSMRVVRYQPALMSCPVIEEIQKAMSRIECALPGYVLLQFLFPEISEIYSFELSALRIGLSFGLLSLIGLVLNYTTQGIRLTIVTTSLTSYVITFVMAAATGKVLQHSRSDSKALDTRFPNCISRSQENTRHTARLVAVPITQRSILTRFFHITRVRPGLTVSL